MELSGTRGHDARLPQTRSLSTRAGGPVRELRRGPLRGCWAGELGCLLSRDGAGCVFSGVTRPPRCPGSEHPRLQAQWAPGPWGPGEHPGWWPVGKSHFSGRSTFLLGTRLVSQLCKPNPGHRLNTRDPLAVWGFRAHAVWSPAFGVTC